MDLAAVGRFLSGLRVVDWLKAVENVLKQTGIVLVFLFVLAVLVYETTGGFSTVHRLIILGGIFVLCLLIVVGTFILAVIPGDRLYSPKERTLSRGRQYGTRARPLPRAATLELESEQAPPPALPESTDDQNAEHA
jgi:hypothetical protein